MTKNKDINPTPIKASPNEEEQVTNDLKSLSLASVENDSNKTPPKRNRDFDYEEEDEELSEINSGKDPRFFDDENSGANSPFFPINNITTTETAAPNSQSGNPTATNMSHKKPRPNER